MTFIITDVGCNHDGDFPTAVALTRAAAAAGVDAVKFQHFIPARQANGDPKVQAMLEPLQMHISQLLDLKALCDGLGVEFMCTPFCTDTLAEIAPMVKRVKIASGQVKNMPFLRRVGMLGKPVIISNGMCTDADLDAALAVLPKDTTVLSCISLYPTPFDAINVMEMDRLLARFPKKIGYSCHAGSPWPTIAAAALGAAVVEAHITHSRSAPGPDHSSSLEVGELQHWVKQIRAVSK